jgi:chaperonin GroES
MFLSHPRVLHYREVGRTEATSIERNREIKYLHKGGVMLDITQIRPLPGFVLVEPDKVDPVTETGIYLPPSYTEDTPQHGVVIAIGDTEAPCRKGDRVIFKKWGGNDIEIGEQKYHFLQYEDLLAAVSSEGNK